MDRLNKFGRTACEVDLKPVQLPYLKKMMERHAIPDVAKALRVLVNYAMAVPAEEEQIFRKTRCRPCI